MDLFETIETRHSYRNAFSDAPIAPEALKQIIQAGLLAPSGANQQTTEFVVLTDAELLKKVAELPGGKPCLQTAQVMILCIVDRDPKPVFKDMEFQVEDCAAAVTQMLLAISALGLASVWIDGWLRAEHRAEQLATIISLPPEKVIRVLLPIGVPATEPCGPPKKAFAERACFNCYDLH